MQKNPNQKLLFDYLSNKYSITSDKLSDLCEQNSNLKEICDDLRDALKAYNNWKNDENTISLDWLEEYEEIISKLENEIEIILNNES